MIRALLHKITTEDSVLELTGQKPEVKNIIPVATVLLPESICAAVVRHSRDVCWADGKRETSSSSVLP